ncbi:camp-dependent protein kinase regulatory subunit [Exidia glandulosa HHB12029]|uniref:cAMP-dependent protein kinase regulatory subunit n=1 Tax=Exidia glandulosa HHB12029 TaxID=1314781 RepID=A0A165R3C1_EXIGL|nr:camp-dependent protein kinase regulatory subunit [Exidia glandulosa HHB12029]
MSTFDTLLDDLRRDFLRVQPKDSLQYCARWFQDRLEEQRTRIRDALVQTTLPPELPAHFFIDQSSSNYPSFSSSTRSSAPTVHSPFGTLNVPGNARLPQGPTISFNFDGQSPFNPASSAPEFSPTDFLAPPQSALGRRTSVSAESIEVTEHSDTVIPFEPKTPEQTARIKAAITNNFIFRELNEEQELRVIGAMSETRVAPNEVVIKQGDDGDYFYVVESGLFYVYVRPTDSPALPAPFNQANGTGAQPPASWNWTAADSVLHPLHGKKVTEVKDGDYFGELALMYNQVRAATVMCIEPATLWKIDRVTFRTIVLGSRHRIRETYKKFLAEVPLLSALNHEDRGKIADALQPREYADGEAVVVEGEKGESMFFIESGEAVATKRMPNEQGEVTEIIVGRHKTGDYFGELSLLHVKPRAATVRAIVRTDPVLQPKLKVAVLGVAAFTRLLGSLRDIMERNARNYSGMRQG